MAIVPLRPVEWGYDTVTGEIVLACTEAIPNSSTDPATFQPANSYTARFLPTKINKLVQSLPPLL